VIKAFKTIVGGDSARGRTALLMSATAFGQGIALAASPLLTRLLGPAAFGVFGVYLATLGTLGAAASWRLGLAVPIPESDEDAAAVVVAGVVGSVLLSLVAAVAVFLSGGWIARTVLDTPAIEPLLWLVPAGMLGVGLTDVLSGWCLRHKQFPPLARIRISRSIGTSVWQVIAAFLARSSAVGLITGDVAGRLFSVGEMTHLIVRTERERGTRLSWRRVRDVVSRFRAFAFISTPSSIINAAGAWAPVLLLTYWWGPVASGLYVLGQRVIGVPIGLLGDSAGQVYIAELAARARGAKSGMPTLFTATAKGLFLVGVVPALALLLLGPMVFRLGFGAEWNDAGVMLQWQAVALVCQLVAIPLANTLMVLRYQRRQFAWDAMRLVVTILGFWYAHKHAMTAIGAVAIFSGITAITYLMLIVLGWRAVHERSTEPDGDTAPSDALHL
jgi:O-antigen/teichoic acid export membrane protein